MSERAPRAPTDLRPLETLMRPSYCWTFHRSKHQPLKTTLNKSLSDQVAYLFRPPVRRAEPLRTVFRLVVFRAVFRAVVFRAVVFRLIVFRADALRLLVAFFFFVGAMLTKPLQTLLVIVNAADSTRPTKSKQTRPA